MPIVQWEPFGVAQRFLKDFVVFVLKKIDIKVST